MKFRVEVYNGGKVKIKDYGVFFNRFHKKAAAKIPIGKLTAADK
ncbi:MAG: hypothetical protein AB8B69_14330 [Chitinophagales bacterium]